MMLPPTCNKCGSDICEHTIEHMDKMEEKIKDLEEELDHAMYVQSEKDAEITELKGLLSQAVEGLEKVEKGPALPLVTDLVDTSGQWIHIARWMQRNAREVLGRVKK